MSHEWMNLHSLAAMLFPKKYPMQFNIWFFAIVISLFLIWKLDFISTLLNMKSFSPEVPETFKGIFDQEKYELSQEYTRTKSVISLGEGIISLTMFFAFWWLGGFAWLDNWVRGFGKGPILTGMIFIGVLVVAQAVLSLPLDLYKTFVVEAKFGFNRMTFGTYVADMIKGGMLALIIGAPLLAGLLWLFENVNMAWLWGWVLVTVLSLLMAYVAPTWIMPLFNKFEPLEDGELKTAIEEMAAKCDFPLTEVTIMDGSKRSSKSNAFFTGFGKKKRIALFDTLVKNHTVPELVGVLAHEIGHYKKKHIVKGIVVSILTMGAMFFLLGLMMKNRSLFDAFGIKETSVYASLVLFGILVSPLNTVLSIGGNMLSRKHEFEADAYAAEVTGKPEAMATALKKLSKDNLSNLTPHPFYVFLNYSHPPVLERIAALEKK